MPLLDLDAPIVPGQSAGGYRIGHPIDDILRIDGDHLHQEIIRDYPANQAAYPCIARKRSIYGCMKTALSGK